MLAYENPRQMIDSINRHSLGGQSTSESHRVQWRLDCLSPASSAGTPSLPGYGGGVREKQETFSWGRRRETGNATRPACCRRASHPAPGQRP